MYRLPRNAICAPCYEGAKAIIGLLSKMDEREGDGGHGSVESPVKPNSSTTMVNSSSLCVCSLSRFQMLDISIDCVIKARIA
jgi:hypothetical protein